MAARLGKMPTTWVRRRSSVLSRPRGVVGPDIGPVVDREGRKGEQVFRRVSQHVGGFVETAGQLGDDPYVLGPDAVVVGLLEDGAHHGGHHALGRPRHPGQQVPGEIHSAALPRGTGEHSLDGGFQALVVVGGDQCRAA